MLSCCLFLITLINYGFKPVQLRSEMLYLLNWWMQAQSRHQDRREGGAEGVTVRGLGDTGGPGVLNCQV